MLGPGVIIDGRYELISLLGEGGMGSVFKGKQIDVNREVALKFLHSSLLIDEEHKARFLREAKILHEISHPNLPIFYHIGSWEGSPYMVMELLDGKSLGSLLAQHGPLDAMRTFRIGIQACDALSAAHSKDIVHRDLKPTNIMLLSTPEPDFVKVLDFGLARVMPGSELEVQKLTQTGLLIGSVHYMSPEQCLGQRADERSDVYSLACVLFEAMVGAPPLEADNPIGLLHKHVHEMPDMSRLKHVPPGTGNVLSKAMAKNPNHRYRSMSDFRADLYSLLQGENLTTASASNTFNGNRSKTLIGVLALSILIGGAVLSYNHFTSTRNAPAEDVELQNSILVIAKIRELDQFGHAEKVQQLCREALDRHTRRRYLRAGDFIWILKRLTDQCLKEGNPEKARQTISKYQGKLLRAERPELTINHILRGESFLSEKEYQKALVEFQQAEPLIARTPSSSEKRLLQTMNAMGTGRAKMCLGKLDEAEVWIKKARNLASNPHQDSEIILEQSRLAAIRGQYKESAALYEQARSKFQPIPIYNQVLMETLGIVEAWKRPQAVITMLEPIVPHYPSLAHRAGFYTAIGMAYTQLGMVNKAEPCYLETLKIGKIMRQKQLKPNQEKLLGFAFRDALYWLAQFAILKKNQSEAQKYLNLIAKYVPICDDPHAKRRRILYEQLWFIQGRREEAMKDAKKYLQEERSLPVRNIRQEASIMEIIAIFNRLNGGTESEYAAAMREILDLCNKQLGSSEQYTLEFSKRYKYLLDKPMESAQLKSESRMVKTGN